MQNSAISIEKNALKGIVLCIIAYFFISLIGVCEKSISSPISIPIIIFFQNIICLILLLPSVAKNHLTELKIKDFHTYSIRIISGVGCYAALFYIIRYVPISEALLFQYSASLWIPFILLFWFEAKMDNRLWYGIIIGFIGIIIILKPTSSLIGVISFVGVLCGILQGLSVVSVRKLSLSEPPFRILFYYFLFGALITFPFFIKTSIAFTIKDCLWLTGVGFSTYFAQRFFTLSLHYANATTLAPICYLSIVFSGLFGWLLWHELPDKTSILGMCLVISGCLLSVFISNQKKPLQSTLRDT